VQFASHARAAPRPALPAPAAAAADAAARRVAYDWWKELPEDSLDQADSASASDLDGYDGWRAMPLLAKPSVRFRKTINADNPAHKLYGPRCGGPSAEGAGVPLFAFDARFEA
jgi:hypothetical protein